MICFRPIHRLVDTRKPLAHTSVVPPIEGPSSNVEGEGWSYQRASHGIASWPRLVLQRNNSNGGQDKEKRSLEKRLSKKKRKKAHHETKKVIRKQRRNMSHGGNRDNYKQKQRKHEHQYNTTNIASTHQKHTDANVNHWKCAKLKSYSII